MAITLEELAGMNLQTRTLADRLLYDGKHIEGKFIEIIQDATAEGESIGAQLVCRDSIGYTYYALQNITKI